ncbi:MAG TPA: hypothetical protein PKD54_03325, partial [Pirellulaceae bacterium]|nr:hypothetical protein [Pirellulaceae bacterium]
MLLVVAGGCAPWNSGRRSPKQELRPPEPRSDLYRHQLTNGTAPYADRSIVQSESDLPRTNAPGESIPAFQFTSQSPAFKMRSDGYPLPNRPLNPPGLLAPRADEMPPQPNVVRVDPQPADDSSIPALDESIQLVAFESPVPTGLDDLSTEKQHEHPDVPKPDPQTDVVALPSSDEDNQTGEHGVSKTICDADRCTSQPGLVNIELRDEWPERAAWAALQCCHSYCRWFAFLRPIEECRASAVVAYSSDSDVCGLPSAEQLEQKIGELSTFVAQQVVRSDLTDEQSDYWQVSDQLLQLLRRQLSLLEDEQPESLAPAERNYWRFQVQALVNLLEATNPAQPASVPRHVVAETVDSLRQAMKEMESLANLE